jgi:hypothetical protein
VGLSRSAQGRTRLAATGEPAGSIEVEFIRWRTRTPDCNGWGLAWFLAAELCTRFYASHGLAPEVIDHEGLGYYGIALVQLPCAGRDREVLGRMTMCGDVENWRAGGPGDHGLPLQRRAALGAEPTELLVEAIRFLELSSGPDRSHAACHHKRKGASFELIFRVAAHIAMRWDARVEIWNATESGHVRNIAPAIDTQRPDRAPSVVIVGPHTVVISGAGDVLLPPGVGSMWDRYMTGLALPGLIAAVETAAGLRGNSA